MLLYIGLMLPYLALVSAFLLAGIVAALCLRSEPVASYGFSVWPELRRLPSRFRQPAPEGDRRTRLRLLESSGSG